MKLQGYYKYILFPVQVYKLELRSFIQLGDWGKKMQVIFIRYSERSFEVIIRTAT